MTEDQALVAACSILVGAVLVRPLLKLRLRATPRRLKRINFRGLEVPATGGGPVVIASLLVLGIQGTMASAGSVAATTLEVGAAVVIGLVVMYASGLWDDLQGDERPRGFKGHLGAARGGRITGGVVKAIAGGVTGLACAALLTEDLVQGALIALTVALATNLFNLLDRAPGRAAKVWLLAVVIIAVFAAPTWVVAVSGIVGAVIGILPSDLGEKVMLGDAGVNPMGAVVGIGLATSAEGFALGAIVLVLLLLNGAAEKWSFSKIIESNPVLAAFDRAGRADEQEPSSTGPK